MLTLLKTYEWNRLGQAHIQQNFFHDVVKWSHLMEIAMGFYSTSTVPFNALRYKINDLRLRSCQGLPALTYQLDQI